MHKVLLIDDEPMIRKMIQEYAQKEDLVFLEASDGAEALNIMEKEEISLAVLDVMMPNLDGWATLREIRRVSDIPVIILTARGEERDKLFGFELGADDYIVKPFSPRELLMRIRVFLRRSENFTSARVFEHEGLNVNLDSHDVSVDGRRTALKPKEFELLAFFIRHPRKVFTREKLLNAIWGYDYYGDIRTVDTHIKSLRENLGAYRKFIVTVWGSGYKFEP